MKLMLSGERQRLKIRSGPKLTPRQLLKQLRIATAEWNFDRVSIGFPAPVRDGKPAVQPNHLGRGWVGFDFAAEFKQPMRIINDAALQALGCYDRGRMLFLGLGTGLGSALVVEDTILPLELCELKYSSDETIEDMLGKRGFKQFGRKKWQQLFFEIIALLKRALLVDDIVIGGGNAKLLTCLPKGVRLGHNRDALLGGERLWQKPEGTRRGAWVIA